MTQDPRDAATVRRVYPADATEVMTIRAEKPVVSDLFRELARAQARRTARRPDGAALGAKPEVIEGPPTNRAERRKRLRDARKRGAGVTR